MAKKYWPKSLRLRSKIKKSELRILIRYVDAFARESPNKLPVQDWAFVRDITNTPGIDRLQRALRIVLRKLVLGEEIVDEVYLISDKERRDWMNLLSLGLSESMQSVYWRLLCMEERRMSYKVYSELFDSLRGGEDFLSAQEL